MKDMHGSVVDLSVYLNEGYDENVNWHDWDAGAYGADVGNINYGFAALEVYDVEASYGERECFIKYREGAMIYELIHMEMIRKIHL